jgi:hydrogenase expression/formation protein HypD
MVALARLPGITVATFGDMVRVPGSGSSLERERAAGAEIRICYSPADAVAYASAHPAREVVFLGVGFETTAPAVALSIKEAARLRLNNFSVFVTHKVVPPALDALLSDPELKIDGFILPGHVSAIIGLKAYDSLNARGLPAVITGFEPNDILDAVRQLLLMVLAGEGRVINGYARVVRTSGNTIAQQQMDEVFKITDAPWRGFGTIPRSGLTMEDRFKKLDALERFVLPPTKSRVPSGCVCGEILKGKLTPRECTLFGRVCKPMAPVGPCMVSSEGACAAYYNFERRQRGGTAVE